jgi:hypothetical protein
MIDRSDRATEAPAASVRDADSERVPAEPWIWSLRRARAEVAEPSRLDWSRIGAMALVFALHLGVLLQLMVPPTASLPARTSDARGSANALGTSGDALEVSFVEPAAAAVASEVPLEAAAVPLASTSRPQRSLPPPRASATPADAMARARATEGPAAATPATIDARDVEAQPNFADAAVSSARFFRADGSIALPASVLEDLLAVESEDRVFSHMTPGLAGAESAFRRPPALTYTPTRFDADWKPVRSVGEDALVTLSEALTYENRSGTFRCSLVPPVCTWGRIGTAVELNDPLTLNQAEAEQCQAMWVSIVGATDQGEWLRLRRRFDAECRKPLEIDRAVPAPRVEATESR